jgi:hypothetical protein
MSNNIVNTDELNEFFNIDTSLTQTEDSNEMIVLQNEFIPKDDEEKVKEQEQYIDNELKRLLDTANNLMDAAKYVVEQTPDPDTVTAASSMISSVGHIISEFNKMVLMKERFKEQTKLEKLKINARNNLAQFRASTQKQQLTLGEGNTINIQNNNLVSSSQEDIIAEIIAQEKLLEGQSYSDKELED